MHRCHSCPWLRNDRLFFPQTPFFVPCVGRTPLTERVKKKSSYLLFFFFFFFLHIQYTNPSTLHCTQPNFILQTGPLISSCFPVAFIIPLQLKCMFFTTWDVTFQSATQHVYILCVTSADFSHKYKQFRESNAEVPSREPLQEGAEDGG